MFRTTKNPPEIKSQIDHLIQTFILLTDNALEIRSSEQRDASLIKLKFKFAGRIALLSTAQCAKDAIIVWIDSKIGSPQELSYTRLYKSLLKIHNGRFFTAKDKAKKYQFEYIKNRILKKRILKFVDKVCGRQIIEDILTKSPPEVISQIDQLIQTFMWATENTLEIPSSEQRDARLKGLNFRFAYGIASMSTAPWAKDAIIVWIDSKIGSPQELSYTRLYKSLMKIYNGRFLTAKDKFVKKYRFEHIKNTIRDDPHSFERIPSEIKAQLSIVETMQLFVLIMGHANFDEGLAQTLAKNVNLMKICEENNILKIFSRTIEVCPATITFLSCVDFKNLPSGLKKAIRENPSEFLHLNGIPETCLSEEKRMQLIRLFIEHKDCGPNLALLLANNLGRMHILNVQNLMEIFKSLIEITPRSVIYLKNVSEQLMPEDLRVSLICLAIKHEKCDEDCAYVIYKDLGLMGVKLGENSLNIHELLIRSRALANL